jgi:hypothetical protein
MEVPLYEKNASYFKSYYIKDATLYHRIDNVSNSNKNNTLNKMKSKLLRIGRLIADKIF